MAYTLKYFYNKFLNKIDKEGSQIYSLVVLMEILETETYNFIEAVVKYNENTQFLKDLLLPVYKPFEWSLTVNPSNGAEMLATLPSDYLQLDVVDVIVPSVNVRQTSVIRKGELDRSIRNPNKKPAPEYPRVIMYENVLAVYGAPTATDVKGFYIIKPTFGDPEGDIDAEITINLPDHALEKIMMLMVNHIHGKEGDPRYQVSYIQELGFGEKTK